MSLKGESMNWVKAIEEIVNKVGILAALFVGYLYMQIIDLGDRTDKLETKTEAISEIKADLSAIKASVDLIVKLNVNGDKLNGK
jgi:hypothetical protein